VWPKGQKDQFGGLGWGGAGEGNPHLGANVPETGGGGARALSKVHVDKQEKEGGK